ncbi:hypothetical protein [Hymenobacter ruricola]|uniref:Secreted protein n=1 Tax=Hymenobacter ruricola TaxID=2791023 RepID=A0ABS0IAU3_9BACT|nr:hypothetical protein [Hymenobacter ruricola]MBF9223753.1 hypothetical protein [Hymenobacter ruricola]
MIKFFSIAAGLLALAGGPATAQTTAAPLPAPVLQSVAAVRQQYAASFTGHPELFNGPEYVDYSRRYHERTGHQFFLTPEAMPGSVQYNGQYFGNQQLTYDVVLDQVVLRHPTNPLLLRLLNERVESFIIDGHRFVRVVADSTTGNAIRTGYFEVLAEGRAQLLARRSKRMQEHILQQQLDVEFVSTERLFLRKAGVFYPIKSKGAALRVFADKSKDVQQYLQSHKLGFKKQQLEASVQQLATYYNGLPQ